MKPLTYSQTPTIAGWRCWISSSHISADIWLLIHVGIKVNPCKLKESLLWRSYFHYIPHRHIWSQGISSLKWLNCTIFNILYLHVFRDQPYNMTYDCQENCVTCQLLSPDTYQTINVIQQEYCMVTRYSQKDIPRQINGRCRTSRGTCKQVYISKISK